MRSITFVFHAFSKIALLDRRDRAIHDDNGSRQAFRQPGDLIDLALADIGRRANVVERHQPGLDHRQVDGARKTDGLREPRFGRAHIRRRSRAAFRAAVSSARVR